LSYLLSDYPNSFFAINHPSSFLFLNISSFFFCYLISSISYWYSFLNSSTVSFAFSKFSIPSQVLDSAVDPFHHTKYLFFFLIHYLFRIFLTFYSFSPLIMTGAGCLFLCPFTCPTYFRILLMLTTKCILIMLDSSNSTMFNNITFFIL